MPGGRWPVPGGRWPVPGGRWPVPGGRCPAAGKPTARRTGARGWDRPVTVAGRTEEGHQPVGAEDRAEKRNQPVGRAEGRDPPVGDTGGGPAGGNRSSAFDSAA
ncbi:hypothetical protein GCM10009828_001480 [Actinoplanes couchii]